MSSSVLTVALVGNPNSGKTTLFNSLTGAKQHVGNWPGVTVEQKRGECRFANTTIQVVDLPGIYACNTTAGAAVDERIASEFIVSPVVDVLVNVVDASQLEHHLYLTTQLLESRIPTVLVLNMIDVADAERIVIDTVLLSKQLGCPVIQLCGKHKEMRALKEAIVAARERVVLPLVLDYPPFLANVMKTISEPLLSDHRNRRLSPHFLGARLLEEETAHADILRECGEEADILIADTRYRFITTLLASCVKRTQVSGSKWGARIDRILLNRFLGVPCFLAVMYLLFVFAINVGGWLQGYVDRGSYYLFVTCLSDALQSVGAPNGVVALLANGVGRGMNTILSFAPVIAAMFLFLAFLEDSGYMSRAAFVIDRFMRVIGLPGQAFVPMIVGFGCNVPAVMAARTLENKRDRILTIMMTPFMSCSARLTIYAVFTAAFFPHHGQHIVFLLYLMGIVMAILTGFFLRRTVLQGEPSSFVMVLPRYHLPSARALLRSMWERLSGFVWRAGKLILPICMLIGGLNSFNMDGTLNTGEGSTHSILALCGQWLTPLFAPMGIQSDNWPATIGLLTGVLAKEVVVGSLNTLYAQMGQLQQMGQSAYGVMVQQFDGQAGAFAYLLFCCIFLVFRLLR